MHDHLRLKVEESESEKRLVIRPWGMDKVK
jgi:hypothetical protein